METISHLKQELVKKKYALVGNTSGVKTCLWTKNSLNNKGVCWKEKFYGIKSHRCCQFSPSLMWCENNCLHCWRPIELNLGTKLPKIDSPEEILEGIIQARKKLLMGFKGSEKVNKKKFQEALEPTLFTLSLSGEATLYPKIGELISLIKKRKAISFLVTNGLNPKVLESFSKTNSLPTQLVISTNAPNKKIFLIWHRSSKKNSWNLFNQSLDLMKKLKGKTRRVIRLTLVKKGIEGSFKNLSNMEQENLKEYVNLIKKAMPDFIHVKAFMSVGYSRQRFGYDKMPTYSEILKYSKQLQELLSDKGYKLIAKDKSSCVVLLSNLPKNKIKIKN
jgi:tRNA wybutosine-synthesizing protein 1